MKPLPADKVFINIDDTIPVPVLARKAHLTVEFVPVAPIPVDVSVTCTIAPGVMFGVQLNL